MVNIACYGGVGEIGGNKILVIDKNTKVFLDFGMNYEAVRQFYDPPFLQARKTEHLLGLGILPDIPGIYKMEEGQEEHDIDGVLISHAHGDHYDYIRFLDNDIPIHCGESTKEIITARECSGTKGPTSEYYIANLTKKNGYEEFKTFETFTTGKKPKVGDIAYTPVHVDHSVCGAYGFVLETSDGLIGYTGDLRMHGARPDLTRDLIDEMKRERLDLLLIEGTNINSSSISSEAMVKKKVKRIVERTRGLVLAGFAIVDYDRFRTFYEVAKETGRKFVISMKQAYILSKIQSYLSIPEVSDPEIIVFEKDKRSFGEFEKEVQAIKGVETIDAKGLSAIQDDVLMYASYYDFNELLTIRPKPGSVYILSQSEPFNEEMEIDFAKMHNWLEHHGLPLFKAHASGHATAHELKEIIEEVNPRKVVPIHTERPKLFEGFVKDLGIDIILPKVGEEFQL